MKWDAHLQKLSYVADFETTTLSYSESETKIYISGIIERGKEEPIYFYTGQDFLNYCFQLQHGSIIYFHNLSFDGEFLLHLLFENGFMDIYPLIELDDDESKQNMLRILNNEMITRIKYNHHLKFLNVSQTKHKIYKITLRFFADKIIKEIVFMCSYVILNLGVEKLGETFDLNYRKLEIDYNKLYQSEEEVKKDVLLHQYLKNDLLIVDKALEIYKNKITNFDKEKNVWGNTFSSISLKSFRFG